MPDLTHLHPMIVHFPIALLIIGFLVDAVSMVVKRDFLNKTGFILLLLGTLGAIAAYFSGASAAEGVIEAGSLKDAVEIHKSAAELTLLIVIAAALFRTILVMARKYAGAYKWIAFAVFFAGVLAVSRTGYYGGELVFKHAAGVTLEFGSSNSGAKQGGSIAAAITQ